MRRPPLWMVMGWIIGIFYLLIISAAHAQAAASRNFDGTNDEIDYGNVLDVTTGNLSICAWYKGTEDASADHLFGKVADHVGVTPGYFLRQNSGDTASLFIGDGTTNLNAISATDVDAAWYWLCGTYDGAANSALLYVNGVQEGSASNGTEGSLTTTSNLQMGEDNGDVNDANGLIAYGMDYGTSVLTVDEVNELMWFPERIPTNIATGVKGILAPLWGASTEQDLSGNGRTGTVSGTAGTSTDGPPVMFGEGLPL